MMSGFVLAQMTDREGDVLDGISAWEMQERPFAEWVQRIAFWYGQLAFLKALAQALPGQVSGGIGNLKVIAFSGMRKGKHWVHMEIFEGSYGGRGGLDGMDALDTLCANTCNNPIEDIVSHLPLRISRYRCRRWIAPGGDSSPRIRRRA
jgi:N-methylhydantoinase B/oxoprolinase/acetone carboxylase alpha subunit